MTDVLIDAAPVPPVQPPPQPLARQVAHRYVIADAASGEIVRVVLAPAEQAAAQAQGGEILIEHDTAAPGTHYVVAGRLVPGKDENGQPLPAADDEVKSYTEAAVQAKAKRPPYAARWSNQKQQWVDLRTLADAKRDKNAEINASRDRADRSTFTHNGHVFQSDAESRSRLTVEALSVALTGNLSSHFPGYWKATDNSKVPITTAAAFRALYAAMAAHGATNFARSEALKIQLADAQTREEVDALKWQDTAAPSPAPGPAPDRPTPNPST